MAVSLVPMKEAHRSRLVPMVTEFLNIRQRMTSPERFLQTDEMSQKCLDDWSGPGKEVHCICCDGHLGGFLVLRFGEQRAAWLEQLYVAPEFRGRSAGRRALELLDRIMENRGILTIFVDVIPRNEEAIRMFTASGFDHLNTVQLRKDYDRSLNKDERVEMLGHRPKKS
jgi:GNAT superfamily N-acetyltransferase